MPLPAGIESAFVWCLLWFGFQVALAGLITQQMSTIHLDERVSSRTFRRLGRLNAYLDRQYEAAWGTTPTDDIVPDLPALLRLEVEVERAAAIHALLLSRGRELSIARLLALLEAAVAAIVAGIAAGTGMRSELNGPSAAIFGIGTAIAFYLLIRSGYLATKIEEGDDFL